MNPPKFCLTIALALPLAAAHGAATEHHAETANGAAASSLVASLGEVSIPGLPVLPSGEHVPAVSAGVAEVLPDVPAASPLLLPLRDVRTHILYESARGDAVDPRIPDEPGMLSLVEASLIGGVARRIQAQRFNTDDGVSANDFAICYRLNSRSSVQVIPGDPAPVRIPVSSFAGNAGVTVGMVVRLSR